MHCSTVCWSAALALILGVSEAGLSADLDEFKVKRQEVFEFTEKPTVSRLPSDGDKVTIRFTSKAFCDVTVAVEDANSRIVRHLVSGVLGSNAPEPFQKNSLAQAIVWDGKNDKGEYVTDREGLVVRVSLGLKPRLERTLYWSPKKHAAVAVGKAVSFQAAPEGVYVFDGGQAVDHLRLFDHTGNYVRTIYPFPADKVKEVKGLIWHEFPQDGARLPVKPTYQMCTLLTTGPNAYHIVFKDGRYFYGPMDGFHKGEYGYASEDISIVGTRIALGGNRLGRLSTDSTSGGLPVIGPNIDIRNEKGIYKSYESTYSMNLGGHELLTNLRPHRMALSPNGRTVYLTRYIENYDLGSPHNYWQHGLYRMAFEGDKEPELFLGASEQGDDDRHFTMPCDVACDATGRIYVADFANNRVQLFSPDGKLLKSVPVEGPAQLAISPKNGNLYVFTWPFRGSWTYAPAKLKRPYVVRKFKSADDPQLLGTWDLPLAETSGQYQHFADVDFWTDPPTIWVSPGRTPVKLTSPRDRIQNAGILLLAEKGGDLELIDDFQRDVEEAVVQSEAPGSNRQRLYFDPKGGLLYVGEGGFHFKDAIAIDPATGKTRRVDLPFDAEDMCFDADGLAYLRTANVVARYEPGTWREVPWDYGEEREHVTYNSNSGRREARLASGLALPVNSGWHHGGLCVSPKGSLAVGCLYLYGPKERGPLGQPLPEGKPYTPKLYPGRVVMAAYGCEYIHVWDKHGRTLHEDAIPGLGTLNGVGIDNQDNIYVLSAAPRVCDGKPWFNFLAGTLMKFAPGKGRIVSDSDRCPVKLPDSDRPTRPPDLSNLPGNAWVDGAQWFFGGVGWHGKNHGLGCGCRNTRFALDYFGRSFAPEIDRYSVAVVDTAGNVILRIGAYGNADDGKPLVADGGPPTTRSISGDEVSLMHGAYVATQSDRRVFIADIGNYRIVSVKLDYHATERVPLKEK